MPMVWWLQGSLTSVEKKNGESSTSGDRGTLSMHSKDLEIGSGKV